MVEQSKGTVEQIMVEQWNGHNGTIWWNSHGGTVKQ